MSENVSLLSSARRFFKAVRGIVETSILMLVFVLIKPLLREAACTCPPGFANYNPECVVHGVDNE